MSGINKNTKYMIHLNSDYTDVRGKITTPVGDTFIAHTKFGIGAIHFNGVDESLSIPDSNDFNIFSTTTEDWTISFWVKHNTFSTNPVYFSQGRTPGGLNTLYSIFLVSNVLTLLVRDNGPDILSMSGGTINDTAWHHVSFVKKGTEYAFYLDGIQTAYLNDVSTLSIIAGDLFRIGVWPSGASNHMDGHIDDFYIIKTNNFGAAPNIGLTDTIVVPTKAQASDPGTVLGITGDGIDGQTTQTDITGRHTSISFNNGAQLDTAIVKFGSASMQFSNSTATFIAINPTPTRIDFDISPSLEGSKTISFWVYIEGNGGICRNMRPGIPGNSWEFSYLNGILSFANNPIGLSMSTPFQNLLNTWHAITIVKVVSDYAIYVDGILKDSTTNTGFFNLTDGTLWLGADTNNHFTGRIDDFHIITGNPFNADPSNSLDTIVVPTTAQNIQVSNTKLLLHFDGNINDDSATGHSITSIGSPLIVGPKFGTGAGFFDGINDYLEVIDDNSLDFGIGDFTIECWVKLTKTGVTNYIYHSNDGSGFKEIEIIILNTNKILFSTNDGSAQGVTSIKILNVNTWYHISCVRSGTLQKIFIDGIEDISSTITLQNVSSSTNKKIGSSVTPSSFLNGLIDDFRMSSIARYTSNFIVPTIAHVTDVNTKLLLNFNSDFSDSSGIGHAVNASGNATTIASVFGTGSVNFNGSTQYLSTPDSIDWDIFATNTESWTIDCWFKKNTTSTPAGTLIAQSNVGGSTGWQFWLSGDKLNFRFFGATSINISSILNVTDIDTWHHAAMIKSGTEYGIYLDGVQVGFTSTTNTATLSQILTIGRGNWGDAFNGAIDEVRIQKSNVFTGNPVVGLTDTITVPTVEHTSDVNTKLLLHFNGSYIDSSSNLHVVTPINSPILQNSKFGLGYLDLDGTNDFLTVQDSPSWDLTAVTTEDFTIDFWFKLRTLALGQQFIEQGTDNAHYWGSFINTANVLFFQSENGPLVFATAGGSVSDLNWHHLALVKVGGASATYAMYLDGTQVSYTTSSVTANHTANLFIGSRADGTQDQNGNMDEIRVQKSNSFSAIPNAGLTNTITVPTSQYTADVNTKLLLHFNEGLKDDSGLSNTVTKFNKAQISDPRFGTNNGIFNGTTQYLQIPEHTGFDLFASNISDATIDFWVKFNGNYDNQFIYQQYTDNSNRLYIGNFGTGPFNLAFTIISGGSVLLNMASSGIGDDLWHHVALVKKGSDYGIYIDGVKESTSNFTGTIDLNSEITIGLGKPSSYFEGQLDDFRITDNNAFNADPTTVNDIIVPTSAHITNINTILLIPFDGDFSDISGTGHIVTGVNTPIISPVPKFGEGSAYFNGTTDYLTVPQSIDFDFSANNIDNITLDFWAKHTALGITEEYFTKFLNSTNFLSLKKEANDTVTINWMIGGIQVINVTSIITIPDTGWHHIAMVIKGNGSSKDIGIYIDGIQVIYINTSVIGSFLSTFYVGVTGSLNINYFSGVIDEMRLHKANFFNVTPNIGLTGSFTPPVAEYTLDPSGKNQVIIIT